MSFNPIPKGRGTAENPTGRFESRQMEIDEWVEPRPLDPLAGEEDLFPLPRTKFFEDHARSILSKNESPDIPFSYSMNPYRGCEHGCIYCYARPSHEYLGLSAGIDFETKIFVKKDAPELLREALLKKSWKPEAINVSGITDCYQPVERKLELTRKCMEVMNEFRNPCTIITKNHLVTRDIDIFKQMAERNGVLVFISVTSLDDQLISVMEPRTSRPAMRLRAIEMLAKAGIPVGVNVAPIVPGLTDHEMPAILKAASEAGATHAGYTLVRLPHGVKDLFSNWLENHFPDRKEKVLHRLESLRDGKLYHAEFGDRMTGTGVFADQMSDMYKLYTKRYGLNQTRPKLSVEAFRRVENSAQGELF